MTSAQVRALQQRLIAGGYLPQGADDGNYGPETRRAEQRMLAEQGLRQERLGQQEIEKQRAAAAAAKAAAEQARAAGERARVEAEAEASRVQAAQQAADVEKQRQQQEEIKAYKASPEGQSLGFYKNFSAPLAGLAAGFAEAEVPRSVERMRGAGRNKQLERMASSVEGINWAARDKAITRALAVASQARKQGLLEAETGRMGFLKRTAPGLVAVPLIGEALYNRFYGANDPTNTPASTDQMLAYSNALAAAGFGSLAGALRYGVAGPAYTPDAASAAKILEAEKLAQDMAARPPKPVKPPKSRAEPPVKPETTPEKPALPARGGGLAPYEGRGAHVAARLWSDLGGDPKVVTKKARLAGLPALIDKASDDAVKTAAHLAGYHETTDPRGALKKFTSGILSETKPIQALTRAGGFAMGPLLAAGIAMTAPNPVRAEEYGYKPGESSLVPGRSPAEEAWARIKGGSRTITENPEYFVPLVGEAAIARDLVQEAAGTRALSRNPETPEEAWEFKQQLKAERNLRAAIEDEQRQWAEVYKERPELAPPGKRPPIPEEVMFPGMVQQPPEPEVPQRAQGGQVSDEPHKRAMRTRLSAMQQELQNALSSTTRHLDALKGKKGADRQSGSRQQMQEELIEDIWALHELSKKIMDGKLAVHPATSKKELIDIARQHKSGSSKAA